MPLTLKPSMQPRQRLKAQPWSERTNAIPRTLVQAFGPTADACLVLTAEQEAAEERRRDGHHLIVPVCLACLVVLAVLLLSDPATIVAAVRA